MVKRNRTSFEAEKIPEDGILTSILSSLTMRDAARTSILSSRWRSLWTYIPNLYFDGDNMLKTGTTFNPDISLEEQKILAEERASKFIRCVNDFMQHHRGVGVQNFFVNLFLHKEHADHLDQWISFAIASGAKNLTLNLIDNIGGRLIVELYEFPYQLFAGGRGSSVECLSLNSCSLRVPPNFDGFISLKALYLEGFDVTETNIHDLLSSCHALESLSIVRSKELVSLNIFHPSGHLKYLNLKWCPLEKIVFLTANLTTFEYTGTRVSLTCNDAPRLKKAYFDISKLDDAIDYVLTRLSQDVPHLETLLFATTQFSKVSNLPVVSNKLIHLKYLVMSVSAPSPKGLFWLASLLSAAPFLEKFELHLDFCSGSCKERVIRRPPKSPHNHLKTIEISGFKGKMSQIEIAVYMLNNAIALQLMTVTARIKVYKGNDKWKFYGSRLLSQRACSMASKYLNPEVPPGAKLVLL